MFGVLMLVMWSLAFPEDAVAVRSLADCNGISVSAVRMYGRSIKDRRRRVGSRVEIDICVEIAQGTGRAVADRSLFHGRCRLLHRARARRAVRPPNRSLGQCYPLGWGIRQGTVER
jgi:hypothetical protein